MNVPTSDPSQEGNWRATSGNRLPSRERLSAWSASRFDPNQWSSVKIRAARILLSIAHLMAGCDCGLAQTQKIATHYPLDAPEIPAEVRAEAPGQLWQSDERGPVEGLMFFARE